MKLSVRLGPTLLAVAACMVLAGLTTYKLVRERNQALDTAWAQTQNFARVLEEHARQTLHRVHDSLAQADDDIGRQRATGRFDLSQACKNLNALLPSDRLLESFELLDTTGAPQCTTLNGDMALPASAANLDFFVRHKRGADRELVFGAPVKRADTDRWLLPISHRISLPDGKFAGVVVALVQPAYFQAFYDSIDRGKNGFVTLYLTSGAAAVTSPADESIIARDWAQSALFREHLPVWPTGTARQIRGTDNLTHIYSYRALNDYPVVVTYGLSESAIMSNWNGSIWRDGLLLIAAMIVLFGVAAKLTRQNQLRRNAEIALQGSESRLRAIIENDPECIKIVDANGCLRQMNPAGLAMIEADSIEPVAGKPILDLIAPEYRDAFRDLHRRVLAGETAELEFESVGLRGGRRWMATHAVPLRDQDGVSQLAVTRDITARKQAEADLRIAATAFEAQEGIAIFDASQVILRVNQAFTEITGYSANEAVGQTLALLNSGHHDATFFSTLWNEISQQGSWKGEVQSRRKDGKVFPQWLAITAVKDDAGQASHYVATFIDITQRKASEDQIKSLAFFDPLTHLPNRRLMMDRLNMALAASARHGRGGALLFVDLDNFKTINDSLGHHAGDALLAVVAQTLRSCVRQGDTVARLGGDEFVVMLEELNADETDAAAQAKVVGEKILIALNLPQQLGANECHCTASIGITLFGGKQREGADEPMKRADLAMYQAKVAGRNTLRFFEAQMQAVVESRAAMVVYLREAIRTRQFLLHYQAQVAGDGGLTGVEALVRWRQPGRGMVSPAAFIPLAEETGLILPLGHWVLQTACAQLTRWAAQPERAHLTIAVNVSARQFHQADFVDQVLTVLAQTGANPERLKLELTESLLVTDVEDVIQKMTTLRARGVSFSLDDFGTGYSSLSYLKRLPLDQLKIDQGFVKNILTDPNDAAIAKMVVALAESLGLSVIAEGVELDAQREFLATQGCHAYQGYLFSRPLPIEEFEVYAESLLLTC
jgi:diguanylate cyclase (GGDEF)-like protein/PAS domain S-box-containing protein